MLSKPNRACRIFGLSPDRETVRDLEALDKLNWGYKVSPQRIMMSLLCKFCLVIVTRTVSFCHCTVEHAKFIGVFQLIFVRNFVAVIPCILLLR